ncbi:hypothetical protein PIB30_010146 [Stylosanthes scabra]|uniref:Uncharacterized protein n=1 Tax=Stylosanthes scabra TaxID=79078 RepID=A0ABU6Z341_9FABA|nr:hypothetical protein [Stylosanthes scabra]
MVAAPTAALLAQVPSADKPPSSARRHLFSSSTGFTTSATPGAPSNTITLPLSEATARPCKLPLCPSPPRSHGNIAAKRGGGVRRTNRLNRRVRRPPSVTLAMAPFPALPLSELSAPVAGQRGTPSEIAENQRLLVVP